MTDTRDNRDTGPGTTTTTGGRPLFVFIGLMLAMLLATLDTQVVATALPTIAGDLGGLRLFAWVTTAYLLSFTAVTPLYGKLGDLFGRRRVFLVAIVIFLAGSAACGLAGSMPQLIVFRAVQGIGGGGLTVSIFAILGDLFEPREGARYQSYATAVFGVSSVGGPLLGGLITDHLGWRWIFYVNMPIGVVALAAVATFLKASAVGSGRRARLDYGGIILLATAATSIALVSSWAGQTYAWSSPVIIGLVVASVALIALWVLAESRAVQPIIPLRLFRDSTFSIANVVAFVAGFVTMGALTYLALYLQMVSGASPQNAGLLMLPMTAGLLIATIVSGQIMFKTGSYKWFPAASMAVAAVAFLLLSTLTPDSGLVLTCTYMAILGLGGGLSQQTLVIACQNTAPRPDIGVATSTVTFTRMLGTLLGASIFGAILNNGLAGQPGLTEGLSLTPEAISKLPQQLQHAYAEAFSHALSDVFVTAIPILVVALALALLMKNIPLLKRRGGPPGPPADNPAQDASSKASV